MRFAIKGRKSLPAAAFNGTSSALQTDWVNLNPTMAAINSSLGTVIGVSGASLLLEAISRVVTESSSYSLRKYDTAP